jgi:uncharacterized protein YwgA
MMRLEEFRWLAAAIASHQNRRIVGRTRLQKTIYLLQRHGFPTSYSYSLHFYGPYSEELLSDVQLLEQLDLVSEEGRQGSDHVYFRIVANESACQDEVMTPYLPMVERLQETDATVLELAATYDAFCELGYDHEESLRRLRLKKGGKCTPESEQSALTLLSILKELSLDA